MSHARKNLYANPEVLYGPIPDGDWEAPVPGWGMNPQWAGPSMVGVGAVSDDASTRWAWASIAGLAILGGIYWYSQRKK